jgi:hypothetical protein
VTDRPAGPGRPGRLCGVVLAAGEGRRLRPLTLLRPKALCPVNRRPLLDWALERLGSVVGPGPDRIAVNVYHHADQVRAAAADRATVSDERAAVRTGAAADGALGTAGGLGALRDWVDGRDVVLTNVDAYLPGGLGALLPGWDGERCRLLCVRRPGHGDFGDLRYVGACLLPWRVVAGLLPRPSGLYEVTWREAAARGALDLVALDAWGAGATAVDAGTPRGYLRANLHASGGRNVVGEGAVVQGRIERCVVWDGAWVGRGEHLVEAVRAGTREAPVTVQPGHRPEPRAATPNRSQP